jgi:Proteasome subunit
LIGVKCKDGVIIATEKMLHSKLLIDDTNKRIYGIDANIGMVPTMFYLLIANIHTIVVILIINCYPPIIMVGDHWETPRWQSHRRESPQGG